MKNIGGEMLYSAIYDYIKGFRSTANLSKVIVEAFSDPNSHLRSNKELPPSFPHGDDPGNNAFPAEDVLNALKNLKIEIK